VPKIDLESIQTRIPKANAVSNKAVEISMKKVLVRDATWEEIKDRASPCKWLRLNSTSMSSKIQLITSALTKMFSVVSGEMPKWLYKAVIGMKSGDEKEAKSEFDPEVDAEIASNSKDAESKLCRITLKTIKKGILPEINDEFLQNMV